MANGICATIDYYYYFRKFAYCIRYLPRERETPSTADAHVEYDENDDRYASIGTTSSTIDVDDTIGILPEILVIISPIQAPCFYLSLAREAVFYAQRNINELLPRFFSAVFWKAFPRTTGMCEPIFFLIKEYICRKFGDRRN